jgi:hypothetical protein
VKNYSLIFGLVLFFSSPITTQAQDENQVKVSQEVSLEKVEVFYFHNTRRCATCQAVESVTKSTLEETYPEQLKNGAITFVSLNLEDDSNEKLARELNVSGQTLLILKEGKKKDLTNDAFLYARSNPEKLKEKIRKIIGTI